MKKIIKNFRTFLDSEYEIPLPKLPAKKKSQQYTKQPARPQKDYVNPFKHQQDLQKQRMAEQIEAIRKRAEAEKLQKQKPVIQKQTVSVPKKPHKPEQVAPQVNKTPDKPDEKGSVLAQYFSDKNAAQKASESETTRNNPPPQITTHHVSTPHYSPPAKNHDPIQIELIDVESIQAFKSKYHGYTQAVRKHQRILVSSVLGCVLLAGVLTAAHYMVNKAPVPVINDQTRPEELAAIVGKKATLPEYEIPTVATVRNNDTFKNDVFFFAARAGDKMLMYKQSGKAYLYRPSADKVIAEGPIEVQRVAGSTTQSSPSGIPSSE